MGKLALRHAHPRMPAPPRGDVEQLVEHTANHWYWCGEFTGDPLGDNAPVFRSFSVVLLLWDWEHGRDGRRLILENACGVYACVNPTHWRRRGAAVLSGSAPHSPVLPTGEDAWPAQGVPGGYAVHVVREDARSAICGVTYHRRTDAGTIVTCRACVRAWLARGGRFDDARGDAP
jgi:hypothetical protein